MTVTVGGTTITFNDATTQTTAPVNTNANVTSVSAGSGISVSSTTGAVVVSATGGGTVTSVATGNGLSGGTITTSGTLTLGDVAFNSVGSYAGFQSPNNLGTLSGGSTFAGSGIRLNQAVYSPCAGLMAGNGAASFPCSGTWRYVGAAGSYNLIAVRIS